jgi:hypothetical protein
MFHIATVHWQSDRWVDVQLGRLERHTRTPYRVYAWLSGPEVTRHSHRFFFAQTQSQEVNHARKLNWLTEKLAEGARDEDVLIFLDGDAFPIGDLAPAVEEMLRGYPLAAIRRDEIFTPFPHPSFCATTVGFWKEIEGDWRIGPAWQRTDHRVFPDTGARLLRALDERGIDWKPMRRTNATNLHPLLFGVYDDLIYHHGAGFREPITRIDILEAKLVADGSGDVLAKMAKTPVVAENTKLDEYVYEQIRTDEDFWRKLFMVPAQGGGSPEPPADPEELHP